MPNILVIKKINKRKQWLFEIYPSQLVGLIAKVGPCQQQSMDPTRRDFVF